MRPFSVLWPVFGIDGIVRAAPVDNVGLFQLTVNAFLPLVRRLGLRHDDSSGTNVC